MERETRQPRGEGEKPGQGPFDRPERDTGDPIGDDAYPGGQMLPPTADMDDPIPESGLPGEPDATPSQLDRQEGLDPGERPDRT